VTHSTKPPPQNRKTKRLQKAQIAELLAKEGDGAISKYAVDSIDEFRSELHRIKKRLAQVEEQLAAK